MSGTETGSLRRLHVGDPVLILLLAASLAGNVYQAFRSTGARTAKQEMAAIAVGTHVPWIEGIGHDGKTGRVILDSRLRPSVVFVLTPDCPWCRNTLPSLERLAATRSRDYDFVVLSLGEEPIDSSPNVTTLGAPSAETTSASSTARPACIPAVTPAKTRTGNAPVEPTGAARASLAPVLSTSTGRTGFRGTGISSTVQAGLIYRSAQTRCWRLLQPRHTTGTGSISGLRSCDARRSKSVPGRSVRVCRGY